MATLRVLEGRLKVKTFRLNGVGEAEMGRTGLALKAGDKTVFNDLRS
jgi:hypothetical protein